MSPEPEVRIADLEADVFVSVIRDTDDVQADDRPAAEALEPLGEPLGESCVDDNDLFVRSQPTDEARELYLWAGQAVDEMAGSRSSGTPERPV
jgi:hypothetical protein